MIDVPRAFTLWSHALAALLFAGQEGKSEAALQLLEKAASIAPGSALLRWHLAQTYADLDRTAEAATQIRAALADPNFGDSAAATVVLKAL